MASIRIRNLTKTYGGLTVIPDLSLDVDDHEFVVFVGPSGCGKSTLLRIIAGLEPISAGDVFIGERRVNDVPAARRDIAMVFQDYALYPHMSVRDNMAFALELRGLPRAEIDARVAGAAAMLHIEDLLTRKPRALSGGQRQRVAMGRAIVRDPQVFLFDEPLSNLDAKLRGRVRVEIKALSQQLRTTMVFVTHDQVEAMTMADRIVVLNFGVVQQHGTPEEVYETPANQFVAGFIGSPAMNMLPRAAAAVLSLDEATRRRLGGGGHATVLGVRPEHFLVGAQAGTDAAAVPIRLVEPLGSDTLVHVDLAGTPVTVRVSPDLRARVGDVLPLRPAAGKAHVFEAATGRVLP